MTEGNGSRPIIAVLTLIGLCVMLLVAQKTDMTGFVVYQGESSSHIFGIDEFSFNSTMINSSDGELKMNLLVENRYYDTEETEEVAMISAISEGKDYTGKLAEIDGDTADISKNIALDVIFNKSLDDGDIVRMYITKSDATEIYLCNVSEICQSPGYGKTDYDGGKGDYNITIAGLSIEKDRFNIDPNIKVHFDHAAATRGYNLTHEYETSYYPMQAEIETSDFAPESVYSWSVITADETLEGQTLEYYYSTDSGQSWAYAPNKDLSGANASSGMIRIRILMTSDGARTPVLGNISIAYTESITCDPEWVVEEGECLDDDSRIITYEDSNSCSTDEGLPQDNGTYAYCDFCEPEWHETNSSCEADDTITQYFIDSNDCFGITGLASDNNRPGNNTYACDQCAPDLTAYNTSCDDQEEYVRYYADSRGCYALTGLLSDMLPENMTYDCMYSTDDQAGQDDSQQGAQPQQEGARQADLQAAEGYPQPGQTEGLETEETEGIEKTAEDEGIGDDMTEQEGTMDEERSSGEAMLGSVVDYSIDEGNYTSEFQKIGKTIGNKVKDKGNIAMGAIMVVMIAAAYAFAEIRAKRGFIR